jgi:DNA-binding CsgD family transcriptional regulator
MSLAEQRGASKLADRAVAELVAAGGKPRARARRGVDALTPSERRVVDLAAQELSNRQIAQALFVTEKTVETHLLSAFRKLGVRSRTQLAGHLGAGPTGA